MSALVEFHGVCKSYDGETYIVEDLNLSVASGEFLTLLGPSGSGKTTSLMMLAGFEGVTDGHIFVAGKPIERVPPHKRNFGMVFQSYALFLHMTVAENVGFPLRVRGIAKDEIARRVETALAMVRLEGFGARTPAQLSGGQQQRVAVARALVFEPTLVLMDEPLGALDKQLREQMQIEIRRLHRELGITMIYVTHDQSEALTMSDRIGIFDKGKIVQLGTPEDIYCRPRTRFVAGFMGENNLLPCTVTGSDGEYCSVRLADGTALRGKPTSALPDDGEAVLCVRPARIALGPATGSRNGLLATVKDVSFHGDHNRVVAEAAGAQILLNAPPGPIRIGETMQLNWDPDDTQILGE